MNLLMRLFVIGAGIGIVPAALLYFTIPAYHNYIQWQLQHPLVLIPAALLGMAIGYFTD